MNSVEVLAPAKVNLFLKVLNRREDSYHNILTVFERISLTDKIKISKISKGIRISSDRFITRDPRENLAYKAAELILNRKRRDPYVVSIRRGFGIKSYSKILAGVKIKIKKNIPIAGGLGGGSADAASVLLGINRLFDLKLGRETLMRFARQLGADVPFFISNSSFAIGRSRGDRLKAINSKARFWHLLIYPGFGISTKEAYRAFDNEHLSNPSTGSGFDPEFIEGSKGLTRRKDGVKIRSLRIDTMDFDAAESMLYNDLEDVVISKKGVIGKIIKRLAFSLGKKAILSGSGPSLFCLYRTRKEAARDKKRFLKIVPARERRSWRIFIVRTVG